VVAICNCPLSKNNIDWGFMQFTESFKYKASIDWIELEITTLENSNFNAMRNRFKAHFVEPINPSAGGSTNQFKFRIHNPQSWYALEKTIERVSLVKTISTVKIVAIEIAFDAYSINNDKKELQTKVAEFYKYMQNPVSTNHRLSGTGKTPIATSNLDQNIFRIESGMSVYIGNQATDSISQRIYHKTIDNNEILPVDFHRARYEVTFRNEGLPFQTIEQAKKYKFTRLTKWFQFRKIDEDASGIALLVTKARKQLGQINLKRKSGGGVRVYGVGTKADSLLNDIVYYKLRELTIRLHKLPVVRK
jgi:hypothetical protein